MSADLQFLLLSQYNSYTLRRNGAILSRELLNVTNRHSQRASGTINAEALNIVRNNDGTIELLSRDTSNSTLYQPNKSLQRTVVNDESTISSTTDKINPKQTPHIIAKYRALQRSSGPVSKVYRFSQRHSRRAQNRADKRAARRRS